MKVLVLGSGAREHALALSLSGDPAVSAIACAPGNPGTASVATTYDITVNDGASVAALTREIAADLVVIGPEAPLVAGVADAVRAVGVPCFGPSAAAARIEGSKAYAKDVMAVAGVPTATSFTCLGKAETARALDTFGPPYVVKDDGLAGGKGVLVTSDRAEAEAHAAACERVVVEEHLDGPEASVFAFTDGETVVPLPPAQDFKRAYDGDGGPNTGGMGAYTPLSWAPDGFVDDVLRTIMEPTVAELRRRGTPYIGLLYAGLALTGGSETAGTGGMTGMGGARGVVPKVVEFNARFGDPETQAVLAMLRSPLGELLHATATGTLGDVKPPRWAGGAAVSVVVAAEGYPSSPVKGDVIEGIDEADAVPGAYVLHAGTTRDAQGHGSSGGQGGDQGRLVTSGGRVLSVTASGSSQEEAGARAYEAVRRIRIRGAYYRRDIGPPPGAAASPPSDSPSSPPSAPLAGL